MIQMPHVRDFIPVTQQIATLNRMSLHAEPGKIMLVRRRGLASVLTNLHNIPLARGIL
jgi:hypothetical protein